MVPEILGALSQIVGSDHVLTGKDAAPFEVDWRGRYRARAIAVVRPGTTAEVAQVVSFCREHRIAMVPQGGNTGLCGGSIPVADDVAIVITLRRLNRLRAVDPLDGSLCAEAGCTLSEVQQAAQAVDQLFPLALASEGSCEIGGNISTNAGGIQVLRYGTMRDLVLGLEVVLPDGRIWNGLRALRKDNTGYDLKHLFIGAEGTLGIVTAATLKLFPRPGSQVVAWIGVTNVVAVEELFRLLKRVCRDRLVAFELIGQAALELVLRHIPGARTPLPGRQGWSVLVEVADVCLEGELATIVESIVDEAMQSGWVDDAVISQSSSQAMALWALRENLSEAQKIEGLSVKHDISVPVSQIVNFLGAAESALCGQAPGVRIVAFGHFGDGNLHYNLSMADGGDNARLLEAAEQVTRIVHDLVAVHGGSISAEHGIGQLKREELRRYKPAIELELMARIKAALDPDGLMNPGKIL
ncbi:MAG: FAD-binding oxidoreductase [Zoogloeaceae bacterium]|nr:FAD-binding oxidoreductase [Zoogloeaceae bacterium]